MPLGVYNPHTVPKPARIAAGRIPIGETERLLGGLSRIRHWLWTVGFRDLFADGIPQ